MLFTKYEKKFLKLVEFTYFTSSCGMSMHKNALNIIYFFKIFWINLA